LVAKSVVNTSRLHKSVPLLVASAMGCIIPRTSGAADVSVAASDKDYVVFFGLDVFANDRGKLRPVVGGSEREVVVLDEKSGAGVLLREVPLTAETTPKLGRPGVTIEGLTGEPVHSPAADPVAEAQSQMLTLQNVEAARQQENEVRMLQAEAGARALGVAAGMMDPAYPGRGQAEAMADAARAEAARAASASAAAYGLPQFRDFNPNGDGAEGRHDGFEVAFRISAPRPESDAYGVLRLIVRDPQDEGTTAQALKVFRLRELTPNPRKVVVRLFGLPPGFAVDSYQVHVYAGGHELATSLSPNRVALTLDEAHQFLVLRHLQVHKGGRIPAEIVPDFRPSANGLVTPGQESVTVELSITAEGRVAQVASASTDLAQRSPELESALRDLRFFPALLEGNPVASTGVFALGELFR
jgi:hypothetical protein